MRMAFPIAGVVVVCLVIGLSLTFGGREARAVFPSTECTIHPLRTVVVGSQASGVIVEMLVDEGDTVQRGQPIARLDDLADSLAVSRLRLIAGEPNTRREAEIRLEHAEDDYQRAQKVASTISEVDLLAAKRTVELRTVLVQAVAVQKRLAFIDYLRAKKRLEDRCITAPIDGVVLIKHREVGESVDEDTHTPVVTLIDISRLRAETPLPVERIVSVRLGERATVTCDVFPDHTIEGRVVFIEPVHDPATQEFNVKVEFVDSACKVRPGMRGTVRILPTGETD